MSNVYDLWAEYQAARRKAYNNQLSEAGDALFGMKRRANTKPTRKLAHPSPPPGKKK